MSIRTTADPADVAEEFRSRVERIVWCTLATVAPGGRPWTRVVHPIWEGTTGWLATSRRGVKTAHLAHEPRVSLTYWDPAHDVVTVHAVASWADDRETRARVWDLFREASPPVGYDPERFWPGGPHGPTYGALRLDATRIDVTGLTTPGGPRWSWRQETAHNG